MAGVILHLLYGVLASLVLVVLLVGLDALEAVKKPQWVIEWLMMILVVVNLLVIAWLWHYLPI